MIKIFGKGRQILTSDLDTWIVKWKIYTPGITINYPNVKECYKAFSDKDEAKEYAKTLNDAMHLVGITALPSAEVYKQKVNSL